MTTVEEPVPSFLDVLAEDLNGEAPEPAPHPRPNVPRNPDRPRRTLRGSMGVPRKDAPPEAPRAKREIPYKEGMFVEPVENLYGVIAMALMPFRPLTGQAIVENAHTCAQAWDRMAKDNEIVRRICHSLSQTSNVGVLVAAHAPIVMMAIGETKMRDAGETMDAEEHSGQYGQ